MNMDYLMFYFICLAITLKLIGHVQSTCVFYPHDSIDGVDTILVQCELLFENLFSEIISRRSGQYTDEQCRPFGFYFENGSMQNTCTFDYNRPAFTLELEFARIESLNYWSDDWMLNEKIHTIALSQAHMTEIPNKVYKFPKLVELEIVHNQIKEVSLNRFINLSRLKSLNVSHNVITILKDSTASAYNTNVNTIDISHNLIENLTNNCFQRFSNLLHLNLSHNLIENINILTFEGISLLETLDLSYNRLTEIDNNLARFINLQELVLNHNNLTSLKDVNFRAMERLEKLDLSSNQIKGIEKNSFGGLTDLKILNLGYNRLSEVSKILFHNNKVLTDLTLIKNNITTIESEAFQGTHITKFELCHNCLSGPIKSRTFMGISTDTLDLSSSKITTLEDESFFGITNVRVLNLSSNIITSISKTSFKSLQSLRELDMSYNDLNSIDFDTSDLGNLTTFRINHNFIGNLAPTTFSNLTFLTNLDLSHNNISEIKSDLFIGLSNLEVLDLSNNILLTSLGSTQLQGLVSIKQIHFTDTGVINYLDGAFSGLRCLRTLNSTHGKLTHVAFEAFKETGAIEILDLSFNIIESLTVNSSSIAKVKIMYLNHNKITNITKEPFFYLTNLETLNLNNNNIVAIAPEMIHLANSMTRLDLSYNSAMNIDIKVLDSLSFLTKVSLAHIKNHFSFEHSLNVTIEELDLSFADIRNINELFMFRVSVKYLNLSNNKIGFIDKFSFQSMPTLTSVDLSCNLISFIQPGSFRYTNNVIYLNLRDNKLPSLQFGVLDGLNVLESLNLSNNVLHTFEKSFIDNNPLVTAISLDNNAITDINFDTLIGTNLKIITIGGNPISCNALAKLNKIAYTFIITAETFDYHSENIKGIKCKSDTVIPNFTWPNTTDINGTVALYAFAHAFDNFQTSIKSLLTSLNDAQNKTHNDAEKINTILENYLIHNNISNTIEQSYLKELTKSLKEVAVTNNNTANHIEKYIKNSTIQDKEHVDSKSTNTDKTDPMDNHYQEKIKLILNTEKEKILNEMRLMFQSLKNAENNSDNEAKRLEASDATSANSGPVEKLMYVISVSLFVLIIISAFILLSKLYKTKYGLYRNNRRHSSTHPIANSVIELQDT